jgi:hypothetical protein
LEEGKLPRAVFRIILLPLMAITHVTAMIFRTVALITGQRDQASVLAFAGAAVMTISVYIALPIAAVAKSKQTIRGLIARWMPVKPQQRNAHPTQDHDGSMNLPASAAERIIDLLGTRSHRIPQRR